MSRFNEKYIENQLVKACNIALKKYTVNYNHADEVATIGINSAILRRSARPLFRIVKSKGGLNGFPYRKISAH
jgi:hypothetical protein